MNKYRVFFDQINQCFIDVKSRTLESAMLKAEREWKEDNEPYISYVSQDGKEVFPHKKSGQFTP